MMNSEEDCASDPRALGQSSVRPDVRLLVLYITMQYADSPAEIGFIGKQRRGATCMPEQNALFLAELTLADQIN